MISVIIPKILAKIVPKPKGKRYESNATVPATKAIQYAFLLTKQDASIAIIMLS